MKVEALAPRCPPQRHLVALADPAMRGAGLVLRVHGIGEVDDLVGGQPVEQLVVSRDEGGLPWPHPSGRQAFRALVFEAQAMQQRQATRMAVNHAPSRRDIGRHLAAVAHQRRHQGRALPRPWHSSNHRPAAKSRSPGAPHRGSHSGAASPPSRPCVPWRSEIHREAWPKKNLSKNGSQGFSRVSKETEYITRKI